MNSMNSIGKIGPRVLFTSLAAILILVGPLRPVTALAQADTDPLPA
jgi:hypothetical protein